MYRLWRRTQRRESRATRERSFTELRFASFPLQFCRTARAVKGQDKRPTGALDSPPRPRGMCVRFSISCVLFFRQSRCLHRWAPEPTSPIPSKGIQADQEVDAGDAVGQLGRSEEHTSELQSQSNLVCRLLLEKKN